MNLLVTLLTNSIAVFITSYLLPGVKVADFFTAVIVAIGLGLANMFLKPILFLLTLPLNILTLGLFTFVINALLVLLVSNIVSGFFVENFLWALAFSFVITLVSSFLNRLVK